MRAESPADDQAAAIAAGHVRPAAGRSRSRTPARSQRGREDQARAGPAGGRPQEPAPARRADEQPRSAQSRTAIAEALQDWPGAMVIVSHDTEFVEALAPERVLLMPDGDARLLGRGPARPSRAGLDRRHRPVVEHPAEGRYALRTPSVRRTWSVSPTASADLVFVNGAVYTVDAARSWAQAVAVTDGRIATVGTDADVRTAVGPSDRGRRPGRTDAAAGVPGRARPSR